MSEEANESDWPGNVLKRLERAERDMAHSLEEFKARVMQEAIADADELMRAAFAHVEVMFSKRDPVLIAAFMQTAAINRAIAHIDAALRSVAGAVARAGEG
jgi:hypothetical protein